MPVKKGSGKVRPDGDDPFEDLLFVIDDTFMLVDEICEELSHAEKKIKTLKKKYEALQKRRAKTKIR